MPVELQNKTDGSIHVSELKEGQIGIITDWIGKKNLGFIVQRKGIGLIKIGVRSNGWEDVRNCDDNCRVQVLKNGTKLTITDNE